MTSSLGLYLYCAEPQVEQNLATIGSLVLHSIQNLVSLLTGDGVFDIVSSSIVELSSIILLLSMLF